MKKKYSLMVVLAVTAFAPFFAGCDGLSCEKITPAKDAVRAAKAELTGLQMRFLMLDKADDQDAAEAKFRAAWTHSCMNLKDQAETMEKERGKLRGWIVKNCEKNKDEWCKDARDVATGLEEISGDIKQACRAAKQIPFLLFEVNDQAVKALASIERNVKSQANKMMDGLCKKEDARIVLNDSGASRRDSSNRPDELGLPGDELEGPSSGSAQIAL